MKGYEGICRDCIYGDKLMVESPCYFCISNEDIALHKPNSEIDFADFKPREADENG